MNDEGPARTRPASSQAHTVHDRPAQQIAQRATRHLLALEGALRELAASGDSQYAANTIWLATARLDFHFTKPFRCVLEEWDLAA